MPRKKRTILTNIFPLGGKKFREVILKIGGKEKARSLAPLNSPRDIENMIWVRKQR